MIAFVVLPVVIQSAGSRPTSNPVVVHTARYGDLNALQLRNLVERRERLLGILEEFVLKAAGFRRDLTTLFGPATEEDVVDTWLLSREAERLGMVVSDEAINSFIRELTQERLTRDELKSVLRGYGMEQVAFFDMLREELKAQRMWMMFVPSLGGVPPAQRWDYYLRVHRKASVELIPVPVESLVGQVAKPDPAVLEEFFEEHKDELAEPNSPEPGFRLPHRVKLEYFVADVDQFIEAGGVSEEEVLEEYRRQEQERGSAGQQPGAAAPEGQQPGAAAPEGQQPGAAVPETGPALPGEQPAGRPSEGLQTPPEPAPEASASPSEKTGEQSDPGEPATGQREPSSQTPGQTAPETQPPAGPSPPGSQEAPAPESVPAASDGSSSTGGRDRGASGGVRVQWVSMAADPSPTADEGAPQPAAGPRSAAGETDRPEQAAPETGEPAGAGPIAETDAAPPSGTEDAPAATGEAGAAAGTEPEPAAGPEAGATTGSKPGPATRTEPDPATAPEPGATTGTEPAGASESGAGTDQPPAGPEGTLPDQPPAGPGQPPEATTAEGQGEHPVPEPPQRPDEREEALRRIREELAREKIGEIYDALAGLLRTYGDQYNLYLAEREQFPDQRPPQRPDFGSLAAKHHFGWDATGLLSQWELRDHEIGGAWVIEARSQVASVAFERLLEFKPLRAEDLEGKIYLFWKVEDKEARVPEYAEVRDEVLHTWKLIEARSLARQRADALAQKARESGLSLAATFADHPETRVLNPKPFSWLSTSGASATEMVPTYYLSGVEGVEAPGEDFMRAVFTLSEGEIGVAFNAPKTVAYVVRVMEFAPSEVVLWEGFQVDRFASYMAAARRDQQDIVRAWRESFRSDAGLEWERPPVRQPGG